MNDPTGRGRMARLKQRSRQVRVPGPERKRIILEQAMELFSRRGFHGASIDAIVAASGITKPVLYDHFSSKGDLYIQVCKHIRERLLAAGNQVVTPSRGIAERIRAGVEAFFEFAEQNPAAIRILLSPPRDEKRLYGAVQAVQDEATAAITKMYLAIGVTPPRDAESVSQLQVQVEFIKRGLHALGQWRLEHASTSRDVVVDAISRLIHSGLVMQRGN
jgi:AcrR family transcriptional regulator